MIHLHELKYLKQELKDFFDDEGQYFDDYVGTVDIEIIYAYRTPKEYTMFVSDRRHRSLRTTYHFDRVKSIELIAFGNLSEIMGSTHRLVIELETESREYSTRYYPSGTVELYGTETEDANTLTPVLD